MNRSDPGLISFSKMFLSVWRATHRGARCAQIPFVYFDSTNRCNSSCVTCEIGKGKNISAPELTTDEVIGLIPALQRLNTRLVSIAGGEPTMRDDLETCIAAFSREGIAVK